jgi:hypothetical protein
MSHLLTYTKQNFFKKLVAKLHKKITQHNRVKILSEIIHSNILALNVDHKISLKILDVGCGDMKIFHSLKNNLPSAELAGIDVFQLPEPFKNDPYWQSFRSFNGINIPFENGFFDFILLIDVLHHIQEDKQLLLLKEAKRVSKMVIIKDHFEFGFFSRQVLRLMDFAGNWANGVSIPERYFSKKSFASLLHKADCKVEKMIEGIDLYKNLKPLNFLLKPQWQFICIGKFN